VTQASHLKAMVIHLRGLPELVLTPKSHRDTRALEVISLPNLMGGGPRLHADCLKHRTGTLADDPLRQPTLSQTTNTHLRAMTIDVGRTDDRFNASKEMMTGVTETIPATPVAGRSREAGGAEAINEMPLNDRRPGVLNPLPHLRPGMTHYV
ncbi:hypothetical protein FRC00_013974, partial [Tulasnella sp. 408]